MSIEDMSFLYFESIKKNLPNGASIVQVYEKYGYPNIVVIRYEWGNPKRNSYTDFDYLTFKRNKLIEDLLDSF
jgi:hypothetical protein